MNAARRPARRRPARPPPPSAAASPTGAARSSSVGIAPPGPSAVSGRPTSAAWARGEGWPNGHLRRVVPPAHSLEMSEVEEPLDAERRAAIADYWWRRAEGELTSWVGFQHVLSDLTAEGAPLALLGLAERAVADERKHSRWCAEWAAHFGHASGEVRARSHRPVAFTGATEAENRVLRVAFCCFTETV